MSSLPEFNYLLGKSKHVAEALLEKPYTTIRVMHEDGEDYFGTCDFRLDRLNVTVIDGLITSVDSIG